MNTTDLLKGLLGRGLTQTEIAKRTGIPQPRLSKWSRGKVPTGAEDALKLRLLYEEAGCASVDAGAVGRHPNEQGAVV